MAPKRGAQATFVRPTSSAVGLATVLLRRLAHAQNAPGMFLPGNVLRLQPIKSDVLQAWEHNHTTVDDFASTPLGFWADIALIAAFDSVWDLLMREPSNNATRISTVPLQRPEFWMSAADDKALANHTDTTAVVHEEYETVALTEGGWRTLSALLDVWEADPSDTFLGSTFEPLAKPLCIAFSFSREYPTLYGSHTAAMQRLPWRAEIATRLLSMLASRCMSGHVPHDTLCGTAVPYLSRLHHKDLEVLCGAAQRMPVFCDMVCSHMHELYYQVRSQPMTLFGSQATQLEDVVQWSYIRRKQSCRAVLQVKDMETWYRALWLKWYLVRECLQYGMNMKRSTLERVLSEAQELKAACYSSWYMKGKATVHNDGNHNYLLPLLECLEQVVQMYISQW